MKESGSCRRWLMLGGALLGLFLVRRRTGAVAGVQAFLRWRPGSEVVELEALPARESCLTPPLMEA